MRRSEEEILNTESFADRLNVDLVTVKIHNEIRETLAGRESR